MTVLRSVLNEEEQIESLQKIHRQFFNEESEEPDSESEDDFGEIESMRSESVSVQSAKISGSIGNKSNKSAKPLQRGNTITNDMKKHETVELDQDIL